MDHRAWTDEESPGVVAIDEDDLDDEEFEDEEWDDDDDDDWDDWDDDDDEDGLSFRRSGPPLWN